MQTSAWSWFLMFGEFKIWVLGWVKEASISMSYRAVAAEILIREQGRQAFLPSPRSGAAFCTDLDTGLLVFITSSAGGEFWLAADSLRYLQSHWEEFKGRKGELERLCIPHTRPPASRYGLGCRGRPLIHSRMFHINCSSVTWVSLTSLTGVGWARCKSMCSQTLFINTP